MTHVPALLCLIAALIVLGILSAIDIKHLILPNKLVATFAGLGLAFHLLTEFTWTSPLDVALGAATGGGALFAIRAVANHIYKDDTLGLGDVKLLAAAGLWLGMTHILVAMTLGALAGLIHGLGVALYQKKKGQKINFKTLSVPAGPGFAAGIILAGLYKFAGLL